MRVWLGTAAVARLAQLPVIAKTARVVGFLGQAELPAREAADNLALRFKVVTQPARPEAQPCTTPMQGIHTNHRLAVGHESRLVYMER